MPPVAGWLAHMGSAFPLCAAKGSGCQGAASHFGHSRRRRKAARQGPPPSLLAMEAGPVRALRALHTEEQEGETGGVCAASGMLGSRVVSFPEGKVARKMPEVAKRVAVLSKGIAVPKHFLITFVEKKQKL